MTVSYSLNVSKATFGGFAKLLFRWKGSIFKGLWRESLIFCTLYVLINATYRHALNQQQQTSFATVVAFAKYFVDIVPFFFVVGFYVSTVTGRWMSQFIELPWPDRTCHVVSTFVHGSDERSRMIRRTLARYVVLLQVLTYQVVSTAVRRRFPTTQHLVEAGIMTAEERSIFEKTDFAFGKWWLPCHWFTALATRAKKEGRIKDSLLLRGLFEEMFSMRDRCAAMIGYDWVGVPLAYTQVATIATYLYALALLVGTQKVDTPSGFTADYYFPFVTVWRFFFSVGWLKVAEQLLNPYGEDDDDFELNWSLDRSVKMAYDVTDAYHMLHPKVRKDAFWDVKDIRLPQTAHSAKFMKNPELGSAIGLEIQEADYLPISELCEKDDEGNEYRNQSVKKKPSADRQNSSFIRRVLNSKFAQSLRRKPQKPAVVRSVSCMQGVPNPAFFMGDEGTTPSSAQSTPRDMRKSSQVHLVENNDSRTNSKMFRPRNMNQKKRRSHHRKDGSEKAEDIAYVASEDNAGKHQAPVVTVGTNLAESNESQNDFEDNPEEHGLDVLMPPILEESLRANSLATIEPQHVAAVAQKAQNMYDQSLDLVTEVSEKLLVYRETASAQERWQENEGKGYESCCSSANNDELSEDSGRDEENQERMTDTNVRQDRQCVRLTIEDKSEEKDVLQKTEPIEV